jgi:hypothetical protein
MKKNFLLTCATAFILMGCSTGDNTPLPSYTENQRAAYPVNVSFIDIQDMYQPGADPQDVSAQFPTPPGAAARKYADNMLKAAGSSGTMRFTIEDAATHRHTEDSPNSAAKWVGVDRSDVYETNLKVRLSTVQPDGSETGATEISLHRTVSIPQRFTLAQKERDKAEFVSQLMQDMDKAVTQAIAYKMNLATSSNGVLSQPYMPPPEPLMGQPY